MPLLRLFFNQAPDLSRVNPLTCMFVPCWSYIGNGCSNIFTASDGMQSRTGGHVWREWAKKFHLCASKWNLR